MIFLRNFSGEDTICPDNISNVALSSSAMDMAFVRDSLRSAFFVLRTTDSSRIASCSLFRDRMLCSIDLHSSSKSVIILLSSEVCSRNKERRLFNKSFTSFSSFSLSKSSSLVALRSPRSTSRSSRNFAKFIIPDKCRLSRFGVG